MGRRGWLVGVACCAGLELVAGCVVNVDTISSMRRASVTGSDWNVLRAHVGQLAGALVVQPGAAERIDAEADVTSLAPGGGRQGVMEQLDFALRDLGEAAAELDVGYRGSAGNSFRVVAVNLTTPATTALDLQLESGDVAVSGMQARVAAQTLSGTVDVETTSSVDLSTASGDIDVTTGGGGQLACGSGNVVAQVQGDHFASLTIACVDGDITVVLPAALGFSLDLSTDAGQIFVPGQGRDSEQFRGDMGGGGPRIEAVTHMGNITIEQQ